MKSYKITPDKLEIKGDLDQQRNIVNQRWERLKAGDNSFMGYIQKSNSLIQTIKSIFKNGK